MTPAPSHPTLCAVAADSLGPVISPIVRSRAALCPPHPPHPATQVANSLALGTSPVVRSLFDPEGGMQDVRALDNISFADWFRSHGGSQASIDRMWDPIGERWQCASAELRQPARSLAGLA